MKSIPKAYEPKKFEENIYENWEKAGYFKPEIAARYKKQDTRNKIQETKKIQNSKFQNQNDN